jgi:serine/threonine protein phosphatase 1
MAMAKIARHAELPATLVTLGDYVDRGHQQPKSYRTAYGWLGGRGLRLICLKGNHEVITWQTCRRKVPDCDWWLANGGGATLISYGQNEGDQANVTVAPDEHLK